MANDESIRVTAEVVEAMPNGTFRVTLDNGRQVTAHVSGKTRMQLVRILPGDEVTVELSPFDSSKGRIVYREKSGTEELR